MKQLTGDLQSVVKSLKALTRKAENIAKKLDRLEKAQVAKKPKARARVRRPKRTVARKAVKGAATDTVLRIVQHSRKAVDTAVLRKKTGFQGRKIRDILYRLKKDRRIKSAGKGLYAKA